MEEQKHNPVVENNIQYSNDPQLTEVAALTARLRQLQQELEEAAQTAALKDGVIDELNQRVAERFVEICNRDSAVKGLSNQLESERGKTIYLHGVNSALSAQVEDLAGKLAERFVEICNRDSAVKGLVNQLESERGKSIYLHGVNTGLAAQVEDLAGKLAERFVEICNRDSAVKGLSNQLDAERGKTHYLYREMAALRETLSQKESEIAKLSQEITELNGKLARRFVEICNRDSAVKGLAIQLEMERSKSVWLYHEYLKFKNGLINKLFGWFQPQKPIWAMLCFAAECFHWLGHIILENRSGTYSSKMAVRDNLYTRFGSLLWNVESFRKWHQHHAGLENITIKGETGLVMPKSVPLTTIIIPAYNNIELTRRCIHSIYRIKSRSPFEIVVVDDCSKDDYASLTRDFPEVRVIRNQKNSGFLLTANHGAKVAKGEYILFLNNDTEVAPGWLDELTTALSKHSEAGMIGSQLIYLENGKLQESGNLICKNGEMLPLGRGEDPNHPRYAFFREVDFCSAASIIMRKKVFERMNGFDRAYAPAYFEDPDLGLRLKKCGYKNYVCPHSRVLHQEMASYGNALDKSAKNRAFFKRRWAKYLEETALYRNRIEFYEGVKYTRPRIMLIDAETPMADRGSGGMDTVFFMEYMIKRGYDVVFHGQHTPGFTPKYTPILQRMGVECIYEPYCNIWEYLTSQGWSFSYLFICRIYQARCFDRILKSYCPQAAYIFDTVDVHFVREHLEADLKKDKMLRRRAAETKKYELAVAEAADATIVISTDEKKLLEKEYKLPNIYHIPQARKLYGRYPNPNRHGAVFIGSAHPPNMDGLRYFHDEILPLLPKDFKLTIIGEALRKIMGEMKEYKSLLKCPQFNFVGFVEELGDELNYAKITVAPLRYGAGTKGKVASSMSYGVPCVSSSFGTEGTGMVHGENILIAKTPREFADSIMKLMTDEKLWQKISDGGIKFIRDNYAPESVEKMMDKLFADVDKIHKEKRSRWAAAPVVPQVR